jgi:hypothetical protein
VDEEGDEGRVAQAFAQLVRDRVELVVVYED